jgi:hypothetical protein
VWAAGSTALCTRGRSPVVLTSITPLEVEGQVEVDRFVMRNVGMADEITLAPGAPSDSHPVAGYVIHSPSPCSWPGSARMNEVVALATRTGPYGGSIRGLRVDYRMRRPLRGEQAMTLEGSRDLSFELRLHGNSERVHRLCPCSPV